MKKLLIAILAVVYLASSIGATIHLHYCMDKLVAWSLGNEKTSNIACPFCGMAKTTSDKHCGKQVKGCCKDEQKQIKVDKDQKAPNDIGFSYAKPFLQIANHTSFEIPSLAIISPTLEYPTSHAPPRAGNVPLFIRNSVFRI